MSPARWIEFTYCFSPTVFIKAQVLPEVKMDSPAEQVFISFNIKDGKRAKYEMPVIHGETGLSDDVIVHATGWRLPLIHWWRQVTAVRTRNGVQGILARYQKDKRLTTTVELEKVDYDAQRRRVRPTVDIHPGPEIQIKAVEAKVSNKILKRYVPVYEERSVDNDLLVEGARNLRDYFQSLGYYDVDVTFRVQPVVKDEQTIEYVISLGTRFRLAGLKIAGNKYFRDDDIRERMYMSTGSFLARRGRYSEAFRKKDEQNIANLYRANGFHDVKMTSPSTSSVMAIDVSVTVNIEEGPQWLVEDVTMEGVPDHERRRPSRAGWPPSRASPFRKPILAPIA